MSSRTARRRRPLAAFALVAMALSVTGGAYALFTATANPAQAETSETSAELIAEGEALFMEGCSSCHGLNLEGVEADRTSVAGREDHARVARRRVRVDTHAVEGPIDHPAEHRIEIGRRHGGVGEDQ